MKEVLVCAWDESNNLQGNDYVNIVKTHLIKDSSSSGATNDVTS